MKIHLIAKGLELGTVEARVVDASMGAVGGTLNPLPIYYTHYQEFFRAHTLQPDWRELEALQLLVVSNKLGVLEPVGGIGITDVAGFEEITVEIAGLSVEVMHCF